MQGRGEILRLGQSRGFGQDQKRRARGASCILRLRARADGERQELFNSPRGRHSRGKHFRTGAEGNNCMILNKKRTRRCRTNFLTGHPRRGEAETVSENAVRHRTFLRGRPGLRVSERRRVRGKQWQEQKTKREQKLWPVAT